MTRKASLEGVESVFMLKIVLWNVREEHLGYQKGWLGRVGSGGKIMKDYCSLEW